MILTTTTMGLLTIYLARHGQDEDNAAGLLNGRRDMPLTALGRTQAQHLADQIVEASPTLSPFDAIYSSPLQRAYSTAEVITKTINGRCSSSSSSTTVSLTKLESLKERDFGIMTGTPIKEIRQRCPNPEDVLQTDTVTYFLQPDGAETFPQLKDRAASVIQYLEERHGGSKDSSILLVTHGDFGKMLYAQYYELDWKDVLSHFHFGNSELIVCSPTIKFESNSKNIPPPSDQTHVVKQQQHNA